MRILLLCLLVSGFYTDLQAQKATPVITRYTYFTGKIDSYPVTFHLYRINNEFSGCYYYNSTEQALHVTGKMDSKRFLKLTHHGGDGEADEIFEGTFKDSVFSGTWSSKGKMLAFRIAQKKDSSGFVFDYIWTAGNRKIPKDDNMREQLSYEAATIWPALQSSHPATAFLKQVIREAFGEKKSREDIGKILISQKNDVLSPTPKQDLPDLYAVNNVLQIIYRNPQLLVLELQNYTDQGGAHGLYGISYTNIDLLQNRTLDIIDVIDTVAAARVLPGLLQSQFRKAYQVKKEEKITEYLFNDTIPVTNNFLVTSKGITFSYLPYEIGPYALGNIALFIPFKDIGVYLKPEFKKLIER